MITPNQILETACADMNDSARRIYNWTSLRPYMNMALMELMQIFELNSLPITSQNSASITVPLGETEIAYVGTQAQLPADLIEPEKIWESNDGGNSWSEVKRVLSISPNISTGQAIIYFGVYVWLGDKIQVPETTNDIILKIQYTRNLISLPLNTNQENLPLPLKTPLFLGHKTAALCALLTAQDEIRAAALNELADQAINKELGITIKRMQQMPVRRLPFRARFKNGGRIG